MSGIAANKSETKTQPTPRKAVGREALVNRASHSNNKAGGLKAQESTSWQILFSGPR